MDCDPWLALAEAELPPAGTLERVQQVHALVAQVEAMEVWALAAFAAQHAPGDPAPVEQADGSWAVPAAGPVDPRVVDEVAPALCQGRVATRRRLVEADQLTRCLPRTLALMADGLIDHSVVRAVVAETSALTEDVASTVDAGLGADLIGVTSGSARRRVRRLSARADAGAAEQRVRRQVALRGVQYAPLPDGIASLTVTGPAPQVRGWYERLTSTALDRTSPGSDVDPYADLVGVAEGAGDTRGLDARRYDAFGRLIEGRETGHAGTGDRLVEIAVGVGTLFGTDDAPAELSGHGSVPAVIARWWAQRSPLRRFFTDPATGVVVGVDGHTYPPGTLPDVAGADPPHDDPHEGPHEGPHDDPGHSGDSAPPSGGGGPSPGRGPNGAGAGSGGAAGGGAAGVVTGQAPGRGTPCPTAASGGGPYRLPKRLDRLVRVQRPRCVAPGCSVPASRCDLDHRVPWPDGPTCSCNLHPLCRTHHRMKTLRGWTVRRAVADPRDLTVLWTSPLGRDYEVAPETLWISAASTTTTAPARRTAVVEPPAEPASYPARSHDPFADPPF